MTRNLVRVGGAVLAALAIGGAATTIGVATGGATAVLGGLPTGSSGQTVWPLDEALDQLRGCSGEPFHPD